VCAGFLLRGAGHNLSVRLDRLHGRIALARVGDGGCELHASLRAMAVANGIEADGPALVACRDGARPPPRPARRRPGHRRSA
jgi:hypothetical protein